MVAVAWDRSRWWNSTVSVSSDLEELHRVVGPLRAEGIEVTLDAAEQGPAALSASELGDIDWWQLTTRQRWVNCVLGALDDASRAQSAR